MGLGNWEYAISPKNKLHLVSYYMNETISACGFGADTWKIVNRSSIKELNEIPENICICKICEDYRKTLYNYFRPFGEIDAT